jgi:DNA-binding CsgD family transcriptional regulator
MPLDFFLDSASLKALAAACERIAAARQLDELRAATLESLAQLTGSSLVAWNQVCPDSGRIEAVTLPGLDPGLYAGLGEAFAAHVAEHPVIFHHLANGDCSPRAISDFVPLREFRQSGLYRDFYRLLEATDQVSFILPDPKSLVGVAVNLDSGRAVEWARAVCELVRPVVLQTYRLISIAEPGGHVEALLASWGLSPREAQVLSAVAKGSATKAIAAELSISPRTVDKHVQRALGKLGARTRLDAASFVWQQLACLGPAPGAAPADA